jgi:uncharacterized protein
MTNDTVLITGASSGIGKELAVQFAKHGHSLVIVAPVEAELQALAAELESEYDVSVQVLAKDLTDENSAEEIFEEMERAGIEIEILVNNAGLGQRGKFWEIPFERHLEMLRVNVEAVLVLTRYFLPMMVRRGHGRILNTASVAGYEPGPLLATYHATKAFVLSLSESLATELKDTGVFLTALCPGPVDTDFFPKAEMVDTKAFQKAKVMAPQEVAEAGYEALMKGERSVIPGAMNQALVFSRRFLPESGQAKLNESMYQEVKPEDRKREPGEIEAKADAKKA